MRFCFSPRDIPAPYHGHLLSMGRHFRYTNHALFRSFQKPSDRQMVFMRFNDCVAVNMCCCCPPATILHVVK